MIEVLMKETWLSKRTFDRNMVSRHRKKSSLYATDGFEAISGHRVVLATKQEEQDEKERERERENKQCESEIK